MDGDTLLFSLKIIGNLLSESDSEVMKIIEAGVLNKFKGLLSNEITEEIKREVCWGVANIAAGNPIILQVLIDSDILLYIIPFIGHETFKVQKEIVITLSNLTVYSTWKQKYQLIFGNIQLLNLLIQMLGLQDIESAKYILDGFYNILKCGFIRKEEGDMTLLVICEQKQLRQIIEMLLEFPNEDIIQKAQLILQQFYDKLNN